MAGQARLLLRRRRPLRGAREHHKRGRRADQTVRSRAAVKHGLTGRSCASASGWDCAGGGQPRQPTAPRSSSPILKGPSRPSRSRDVRGGPTSRSGAIGTGPGRHPGGTRKEVLRGQSRRASSPRSTATEGSARWSGCSTAGSVKSRPTSPELGRPRTTSTARLVGRCQPSIRTSSPSCVRCAAGGPPTRNRSAALRIAGRCYDPSRFEQVICDADGPYGEDDMKLALQIRVLAVNQHRAGPVGPACTVAEAAGPVLAVRRRPLPVQPVRPPAWAEEEPGPHHTVRRCALADLHRRHRIAAQGRFDPP